MSAQAAAFHKLHAGPELLILPNAWDAGSARVIEHAGAKAIATSSAAVAWAHGYPDGEVLPPETLLATVRAIARVVSVPVSADIEAAYASDAAAAASFAARVIDAGAVGVNIEDGVAPPDLLCAKIEALRGAAARAGVDLWINARVDVYLRKLKEDEAAHSETVSRARRYAQAGANSIFVPAAVDEGLIAKLVRDVVLPLNLLAWPGLPYGGKLKSLGVRRLSAGSGLAKASLSHTHALTSAFLAEGRSELFAHGPLAQENINTLMKKG
jgi:2-methylisocitrate lyase-like PEP mutase family enzyme